MVTGVYPSQVPCSFCHKSVYDTDALWSEGLPYHDSCWKLHLANELKKYKHKLDLGNITFAEAGLMKEIQLDYDIARKSPSVVSVSKLIDSDKPRFKGNSPLAIASIERLSIKSNDKKQGYISTGENAKLLGGKNDQKNQRFLATIDQIAEPS